MIKNFGNAAIKAKEAEAGNFNDSSELTWNSYLVMSSFVAALSMFNAGYNLGVINIPEATIRKCTNVETINGFPSCTPADDLTWGVVVGLFALGGGFGGLSASRVLQWLGRRNALMFNNIFFIAGAVLMSTATTLAQLGVGRFVIGAGSGLSSVAVSTYIGEIATAKCRGAFGSVLNFMMTIGILLAQIISLGFNYAPGWRILLALTVIPAILQLVLFPMCVETPRYLISVNKLDLARSSLARLRKGYNVENEFNAMVQGHLNNSAQNDEGADINLAKAFTEVTPDEVEEMEGSKRSAFHQLFNDRVQFKHLILALVVHASQQLSGINCANFYSTSIFEITFGKENAPYVTLGVGAINLVVTITSMFLIDRLGRKILLLASLFGMCIMSALIVVGSVYKIDILIVVALLMFVGSFAIGLGHIPWILLSELFPTRTIAAASALAIGVNWFCNFTVGLAFPSVLSGLGDYTFIIFTCITFCSGIFVLSVVPETKGRTVEEILASSRNS